jgi:alkylation response protein AidB-like acyl-CoA dehydrogenase
MVGWHGARHRCGVLVGRCAYYYSRKSARLTALDGFETLLQVTLNCPAVTDTNLSPLEAARSLAPLIRASADEIEAARQLPRPLFEALADARLFHLAVPRAIGGVGADLPTHVQVIEEIGKADASTGWAVNQGAIFGTFSARMPQNIARAIWIDKPRSVVSNTPGATAKAVVVPGGYRVTGRQGFSTGCRHATWVAAHAQIIEKGEVRPEARYLFVPVAQAELLDTWHVRGMRGTGTHHFAVNDVFVPEERTVLSAGAPLITEGLLYKIPQTLLFASGDSAVALGVARSCMNEFFQLAGAKTPRYVQGLLRDLTLTQFTVGQAEAALRSGRAFLIEAVGEIWDEVTSTGEVSMERRATLRLATTHGIRLAAQIVESIYTASGATAAFEGNLIQRHFQDIHVITQHVQGRLSHYEQVGQHWLGIPIAEPRF